MTDLNRNLADAVSEFGNSHEDIMLQLGEEVNTINLQQLDEETIVTTFFTYNGVEIPSYNSRLGLEVFLGDYYPSFYVPAIADFSDSQGWDAGEENNSAATLQIEYDTYGQIISQTNADTSQTVYTYDELGNAVKEEQSPHSQYSNSF